MGISISWLAVQGAERATVLEALALAETGERDEFPTESPIQGASLADGWYVVVFDRYGHALLNDETLIAVFHQCPGDDEDRGAKLSHLNLPVPAQAADLSIAATCVDGE